jgi:arabinofuranosyltransferase
MQMGAPVLVLVLPWLGWKLHYYGGLLPNTFYAKSAANPLVPFAYGLFYLAGFFAGYAAFLLVGRWRRGRSRLFAHPAMGRLAVVVGVWFAYVCAVGADFMEFRFVVPVLPLLALAAGFLVDRYRAPVRQVVLVGVLLAVSGLHAVVPGMQYPVLTFADIRHWPTDSPTSWRAMGETLHEAFPGSLSDPRRPTIAVTALGVISYGSDLRTVDMLGLTDPDVARRGDPIPLYYPGHVRMATVDQLLAKRVDLVVGQPTPIEPLEDATVTLAQLVGLWPATDLRRLPSSARVVEVMLAPDRAWYLVQLRPHPQVDAAVRRQGWRTLGIERSCDLRDLELTGLARWVFRQAARRTCPGL